MIAIQLSLLGLSTLTLKLMGEKRGSGHVDEIVGTMKKILVIVLLASVIM